MTRALFGLTLVLLVWVVVAWFLSYRYVATYSFSVASEQGEFATYLESDAGRLAWTREQTRVIASDELPEPTWRIDPATDDTRAALRVNQLLTADVREWGIVQIADNRTDCRIVHYHVVALALAVLALGLLWRILVSAPARIVQPTAPSDETP